MLYDWKTHNMNQDVINFIQTILPALVTGAVFYGNVKARLDNIEANIKSSHEIAERLARLEEKIQMFLDQNKQR